MNKKKNLSSFPERSWDSPIRLELEAIRLEYLEQPTSHPSQHAIQAAYSNFFSLKSKQIHIQGWSERFRSLACAVFAGESAKILPRPDRVKGRHQNTVKVRVLLKSTLHTFIVQFSEHHKQRKYMGLVLSLRSSIIDQRGFKIDCSCPVWPVFILFEESNKLLKGIRRYLIDVI